MPSPIALPLLNGVRHEWSSAEFRLKNRIVVGIKEFNYNDKLEPTKVYGTASEPIGRTRGVYLAEGSCTMYVAELYAFLAVLGPGFKEVNFDGVAAYSDANIPTITDRVVGIRIKSIDASQSQGADPLVRKLDLDIMKILWNGLDSMKRPIPKQQL